MTKLGLLGRNISHSKSQEVYQKLLSREIDYNLFDYEKEIEIPSLDFFFEKIEGLSITAPYKRHFLDQVKMGNDIKELGAINCIRKIKDGFEATNTDYLALEEILRRYLEANENLKVLLLGDGAMAKVLTILFSKMNIEHKQFSRKLTSNFFDIKLTKNLFDYPEKVIVMNTCSRSYLFNGEIDSDIEFYDLNYSSPEQENFFIYRENEYIDGIELLEGQARHALKFWNID